MTLDLFGYTIELERKKIKNIHLCVYPPDGRVRLSVPRTMSDKDIERFLREKEEWLNEKREKFLSSPRPCRNEYLTGETVPLFGISYPIDLIETKDISKAFFENGIIRIYAPKGSGREKREEILNELYRELLRDKLSRHIPLWESITGLHCREWRIRSMKTRWGTCNITDKRIWLNLYLAQKNISYIDYVILHELCHLKVKDHGKDFEALMTSFMPDWQKRKSGLNYAPPRS